ncbi:MAG: hypothetical protein KAS04_06095 [Candidatus Aenigmarchaeota archaeon]|nr:hypothetical protein [Candidatus Aenigmarchaeota archaeon]
MANQKESKKTNRLSTAKKDKIASLVADMGNDLKLSSNVSVRIHVQSNSFDLPFNVERKNS